MILAAICDSLHQINELPVALTMKHFFVFDRATGLLKNNRLDSTESWDALRASHPSFSISTDRAEWLREANAEVTKDGQDTNLKHRADDVVALLRRLNIASVFSVGVGGAGLEYQIKAALPDVAMTVSEYSPQTVARLKSVFHECESVIQFDATRDAWRVALADACPASQLCLFSRVDAQLTDKEWHQTFARMHAAGIKNVLFIPSGCLTARAVAERTRRRLFWSLSGQATSFAGYLRTRKRFLEFWRLWFDCAEIDIGGRRAFLLRAREVSV